MTVEEMVPRVQSFARGAAAKVGGDRDDFESAALWGLAVANKSYSPDHGMKFDSWCWSKVVWAVRSHMKSYAIRRDRIGEGISLDAPWMVRDQRDDIGEWEGIQQAESMLAVLPPRHRRIVADRFIQGLTCEEIAEREGCTASRVSQIAFFASRSMRKAHRAAA